jgi:hypothetical protein
MPTAKEVAYAYQKLERAEHHINDLSRQNDAFLAERPFKFMAHFRQQTGHVAYRVETQKAIPPIFPLIIGDAIHNLRAALEIMLYVLAQERATSKSSIQFPFPAKGTDDALVGAIDRGQVKFAGKKVVEAIRRLDPRPGGDKKLNAIHFADVRDKHHLLILSKATTAFTYEFLRAIGANPNDMQILGGPRLRVTMGFGGSLLMPATDQHDILQVINPLGPVNLPNSKQEAKVQPSFVIIFEQGQPLEGLPVIDTLRKAAIEVRGALNEMLVAFLDPENRFP